MRKNKLIAGLLGLVMTASALPMQAMAKTVIYGFYNMNFETGEIKAPDSNRFRLNSTRTVRWQTDNARKAPEDWTYEVCDDGSGSNKALKFTFDSEGGTKTLSDNGKTVGGLLIADMPGNIFGAGAKQWWEYSFSYKIDEPLNMNAPYFMTLSNLEGNCVRIEYKNNKIVVGGNSFDPMFGKWVNVKWQIRYYPTLAESAVKITRDYIDDSGETVTETLFEDMGKYTVSMGVLAIQLDSTGMTDGANFMIDNIYAARLDAADLTKVTFDTKGGSAVDPVQTAIGKINLAWAGTPTKDGATFEGWYRDEALTEPFDGTGVEENITVYAKYNQNVKVTFVTNDSGIVQDPMYTGTGSIELPVIEKEGYVLSWWKDADFTQPFDGTGITEDITVYAKWEKLHTVSFDTNGGNAIDPVTTTGIIDFTDINPVRGQYTFAGWYLDKECKNAFDVTSAVTGDITLYARWSSLMYNEGFEAESYNEGLDIANTIRPSNTEYFKNAVTVDETGNKVMRYSFIGDENTSFKGSNILSFDIPAALNSDGSTYEVGYKYKAGKESRFIPQLSINGKYAGCNLFNIETNTGNPVIGSTQLSEDRYIGYDIDGYVTVKAIYNVTDKKASVFVSGRKTDGEEFNIAHELENIELAYVQNFRITIAPYYAPAVGSVLDIDDIYVRLADTHKVTFKYNDGVTADNTVDTDLYGSVELPKPTRENYGFIGWYTDEGCTQEFSGAGVTEDTTVYALWQTYPTVSAISPADGSVKVDPQPTIKINFDSRMDLSTINKSTVKVYKGSEALDEQYYSVNAVDNAEGKTEATITFAHRLDLKGEYTVKVTTGVKNLCYNMAADFTSSFTVAGLALEAKVVSVKDSEGNAVESLKAYAGKTIKISVELKNNTESTLTCYPIFGVYSGSGLKDCSVMQAQTVEGELTPEFEVTLPQNAEDSDKVSMITVDSLQTIKPLAFKVDVK